MVFTPLWLVLLGPSLPNNKAIGEKFKDVGNNPVR
jgi:hypothetical protein